MKEKIEKRWDYSKHAAFYKYRPNYAPKAIDMLIEYTGAKRRKDFRTADIGAGTGNLTMMLLQRGLNVTAVEPNDAMREIGIEATAGIGGVWVNGTGTNTTLASGGFNWVTYGSSFNVIDREAGLSECYRILTPPPQDREEDAAFFTCMWNHRNLRDSVQKTAEEIIEKHIPEYERGVRRDDQRPFIEKHSARFKNIFFMEVDFEIKRTLEEYILAWKSVKNKYWDLETSEGQKLFDAITNDFQKALPAEFRIMYTTRAWTAQKTAEG
ncbi:MAG: class I SAM-dependent methyltransferase [Spirochaetaceae bacterium]|jgi:SAM-dependent methyltransferase|nr:class I SAM-dependent methyltransferase [Spirochaetaceae bacterium]